MQQTVSVPASGTFVFINNRDRININESAFDFSVPNLDFSSNDIRTYNCVVKQAIVRNLIPNVQLGKSDAFAVEINGVAVNELQVLPGNYNALVLASTLQTYLRTFDVGFSVGYDTDLLKLYITVPAGKTLKIKRPQVFTNYWEQQKLTYPSKYDRFLELCGLVDNADILYQPGVFYGINPVLLGGTAFVDINIRAGLDVMHTCGMNMDTIVRVPMDVPYGEEKHYEPGLSACFGLDMNYLRNLRITVVDEWGQMMDVPDNTLVSLSLLMIPIEG